jgi:Protein of unknown function (DUF3604)
MALITNRKVALLAAFASVALLAGCSKVPGGAETSDGVTPTAVPERVYWGDLHLHTLYSFDSFSLGNQSLTPDDAYRFAQGLEVQAHNGQKAKLARPLDFLMVSDHSEYLGVFAGLAKNDPVLLNSPLGKRWKPLQSSSNAQDLMADFVQMLQGSQAKIDPPPEFRKTIWAETLAAAERNNQPGKFTTFAGYEWTSMLEGGNLHRVVLFKDGPDKTGQILPFSALDSRNPFDLWRHLAGYEEKTGGEVIAIAHNGNLANGNMFGFTDYDGGALTADNAQMRARWEPIYETTQVKGDGEAHPLLSPTDEFAGFEAWDATNIGQVPFPTDPNKKREIMRGNYTREALKQGLEIQQRLGTNPYRFGLIGSTDSHTALATADDDNFWGKFPDSEPSAARMTTKMGGNLWENWRLASSGYVAVWAKANTRAEIFAAFKRKEVYATTGPRMTVRLFGGFDFAKADLNGSDWAQAAYAKGVPMGGGLKAAKPGQTPRFLVSALKDPQGANLDRVQVIKGWRGRDGKLYEKIYEVVFAGNRKVDPATGKLPAIGSTVNLADATYSNTIGAPALATLWTDPEFDPAVSAFYYVRVLEIPTPRWTLYDVVRFKLKPPSGMPLVTQERAYSSPIWYDPV